MELESGLRTSEPSTSQSHTQQTAAGKKVSLCLSFYRLWPRTDGASETGSHRVLGPHFTQNRKVLRFSIPLFKLYQLLGGPNQTQVSQPGSSAVTSKRAFVHVHVGRWVLQAGTFKQSSPPPSDLQVFSLQEVGEQSLVVAFPKPHGQSS